MVINKKLNEKVFTVGCSCGCDNGLVLKFFDGELYASTVSSDFYTFQNNFIYKIKDSLKEFLLVSNHKKNVLKEICIKEEDVQNLYLFLNEVYPYLKEDIDYKNISEVRLDKLTSYSLDNEYFIDIVGISKNMKDIFFNRHRKFEIVLGQKECAKLISRCVKILKTCK
jgi:hypothetical protein